MYIMKKLGMKVERAPLSVRCPVTSVLAFPSKPHLRRYLRWADSAVGHQSEADAGSQDAIISWRAYISGL